MAASCVRFCEKFTAFSLFLLLDSIWALKVHLYEEDAKGLNDLDLDEGSVTCRCGNSNEVMKKALDVATAENMFASIVMSRENISQSLKEYSDIRDYLEKCAWCQVVFTKCVGNLNSTDNFYCIKKSADFVVSEASDLKHETKSSKIIVKRRTEKFPKVIDIPIGGHPKNFRQVRNAEACSFPSSLETAAISCRVFPSSVKCIQRCAFGYTLEKGIVQNMQCKVKENIWNPTGFKECQPFVDCTMSLVSGGSSKCSTSSLNKGPECAVECLHFEDKPAIAMKNYMCNIDGKWEPRLPFCVTPGSGLVITKAPEIKLHEE